MKPTKLRNLARVVAFLVIAAIITCTVAFAAGGWQPIPEEPDSGNADTDTNNQGNGDTVENTDGDNKTPTDEGDNKADTSTEEQFPQYLDYITGLEITEEEAKYAPFSFIHDSMMPLYGASSANMLIEVPIENGKTRFVSFTKSPYTLGKIGSVSPTRGYISSLVSAFGGIAVCYGNDDKFDYGAPLFNNQVDFVNSSGYHYTEYGNQVYTNGDLLSAYIKNKDLSNQAKDVAMPYVFCDYGKQLNPIGQSARSITLSYSNQNSTLLTYSSAEGKYTLSKNGELRKDQLNNSELKYDNVFILFANAATYETAEATETIIDTTGEGSGYYVTNGSAITIQWRCDEAGSIFFFDSGGNRLTVNRGKSYIGIMKASNTDELIIA